MLPCKTWISFALEETNYLVLSFAQYVDEVKQLSAALFFQDLLRPAIEMHFGRPARS